MNIFNKIITANDIKKTIIRHDIKMLLGKNNIMFNWNYVYKKVSENSSKLNWWLSACLLVSRKVAAKCQQHNLSLPHNNGSGMFTATCNKWNQVRTYLYICQWVYICLLYIAFLCMHKSLYIILEKRRPIQIFFG